MRMMQSSKRYERVDVYNYQVLSKKYNVGQRLSAKLKKTNLTNSTKIDLMFSFHPVIILVNYLSSLNMNL